MLVLRFFKHRELKWIRCLLSHRGRLFSTCSIGSRIRFSSSMNTFVNEERAGVRILPRNTRILTLHMPLCAVSRFCQIPLWDNATQPFLSWRERILNTDLAIRNLSNQMVWYKYCYYYHWITLLGLIGIPSPPSRAQRGRLQLGGCQHHPCWSVAKAMGQVTAVSSDVKTGSMRLIE